MTADPAQLREILCVQEERIVARDNTVSFAGLKLQLPESPLPVLHQSVRAGASLSRWHIGRLPRPAPDDWVTSQGLV